MRDALDDGEMLGLGDDFGRRHAAGDAACGIGRRDVDRLVMLDQACVDFLDNMSCC